MRFGLALYLLATGCRQLLGFDDPTNQPPIVDGPNPDAGAVCAGVAEGLLPNTCFLPGVALTLDGAFDTSSDLRCQPAHPEACVVVGAAITIKDVFGVVGSRPLVLWSASTIVVDSDGSIDASSTAISIGPGANVASCPPLDGPVNGVGAGGAGGGYASAGGNGGTGRADVIGTPAANPATGFAIAVGLRGGCPGGLGGASPDTSGSSGGAVYLMAHDSITIRGTILATGSAGGGGLKSNGGGGGGGSGGLIALDSPLTTLDGAVLSALGGGGGGGATSANSGASGLDGTTRPPLVAASGGAGTASNNSGGNGGGIQSDGGGAGGTIGLSVIAGGGGGGGGGGYVMAYGMLTVVGAQVQPPIRTND